MALTIDQKKAQLQELTEKMSASSSVIFTHYIGLSVAEAAELRSKLKEVQSEMKVAKKTLMKIAAKEAGLPELSDDNIPGPVSLIFSNEDPLAGAQIAFKFAKDHKQVELIGGIFEGKLLTKEEAVALAKMPSRDVLLATFVGMIQSPLNRFAGVCSSPLSGFARALIEVAKQKETTEESKEAEEEKDSEEGEDNEDSSLSSQSSESSGGDEKKEESPDPDPNP